MIYSKLRKFIVNSRQQTALMFGPRVLRSFDYQTAVLSESVAGSL